ncbi:MULTISPECIES: DUF2079 domain-containing protein [unclassified Crossiella]|uniref:DUF2079 domain-containing protein n=1 Tax=unclassified Crossiella TaxID=2620835 RepID=UPI001FFFB5BB|nr:MULTISPECIES: DUF2079 domain-containing protein [unclassified Crossiella]MCK2245187.1 DUF2079 domain-containing protein [Crossiella sp. S99.2]MCK2258840.1 DUF2079 domain-containing protein [Crossiella sp. S99.1]
MSDEVATDRRAEPRERGGFTPISQVEMAAPEWLRRISWPAVLIGVFGVLPVLGAVLEIAGAPRLHFVDYWYLLTQITNDDGSLIPRAILQYHNEHPMFVPALLFWLDAKFLGGSNHALGIVTAVFAVGIVVVLNRMLPRSLEVVKRSALTVAFAFLVFSTNATEMFGQGMSGVSWMPQFFFATLAVLLAQRGRPVWSVLAALAGCACHGTAFAVFPALALVFFLRGDKARRVLWPLAIGLVVVVGWALTVNRSWKSSGSLRADDYLAMAAGTIGQLWSAKTPEIAVAMGAFTAAGIVTAVILLLRRRATGAVDAPVAGWAGLGTYILAAAMMIGLSRALLGIGVSLAGRYAEIAALAAAALLTLAVLWFPGWSVTRVSAVVLAVAAVTYVIGNGQAGIQRHLYDDQKVAAVAMRVNALTELARLRIPAAVLPAAKGIGVYPFNSDFTLGCGPGRELGDQVAADKIEELANPAPDLPNVGNIDSGPVRGDAAISGWALVAERAVDCVLVLDSSNRIVGGGGVGIRRPDIAQALLVDEQNSGFIAVAAPGASNPRVVVSSRGALFHVGAVTAKAG